MRINHFLVRTNHSPVRINGFPMRTNHFLVRTNHSPVRINGFLMRMNHRWVGAGRRGFNEDTREAHLPRRLALLRAGGNQESRLQPDKPKRTFLVVSPSYEPQCEEAETGGKMGFPRTLHPGPPGHRAA